MGFPIVAVLISTGVSFALGQLRPRVRKPKPQDLEGWKAEEGLPVPYLAGVGPVEGNVVWWGDVRYARHNDELVTAYHANLLMRLCQGPINEILDIQAGGKPIRFQVPSRDQDSSHAATTVIAPALPYTFGSDTPVDFDVNARQMFGGLEREGGLEHHIRVYRGSLTQSVIDELTSHGWALAGLEATEGTARPGIAYAALGEDPDLAPTSQFYLGTIAQPKPFVWILTRYPRGLFDLGLDAVYTNPNTGEELSYTSPAIGFDSNPAEIVYELSIDQRLGLGVAPTAVDVPSIVRAGALWQREQLGQSVYLTRKEEGKAILDELLKALRATYTPHPVTGLLTLTPLRGDYAIGSVLRVSDDPGDANAWDLEEVTQLAGDSHNQVQLNYRRFAGAILGPVTGEPLGHLHLELVVAPSFTTLVGQTLYQTKGRNITNVVVRIGATTLTPVVDYDVRGPQGILQLKGTATVLDLNGEPIEVDYLSNPETMRFEEAHVTEHLLGEQLRTGETRVLKLEAPYTTSDLVAAKIAAATKQSLARTPRQYRWKMNRQGYGLYPGAVCKIRSSRLGLVDLAVRVGDVDQGRLETPVIEVIGAEDIWAEDLAETIPPAGGGPDGVRGTAPAMGIGCGIGGAEVSRIALFASDPLYDIEVWEADDDAGTGAVLVATVPGDTAVYDGTVGKYYRARLVQPAGLADPGPFTPWITCAAVDEDPEDPVCVEPTWSQSIDYAAGTVLVAFTDPQNRIQVVRWKSKAGQSAETAFADSSEPHEFTVALDPANPSSITWEVDYLSCGGEQVTDGDTVVFDASGPSYVTAQPEPSLPGHRLATPNPDQPGITIVDEGAGAGLLFGLDPDTIPALQSNQFDIALHSGASLPIPVIQPGAEITALPTDRASTRKFHLGGVIRARVARQLIASELAGGAELGVQYLGPSGWDWLDGVGGPVISIAAGAVGDGEDDTIDAGEPVTLEPDARDDVRLRVVVRGGDGTGVAMIGHVALQPEGGVEGLPPVDEDPPEEIPPTPPEDPPPAGCNGTDEMPHFDRLVAWIVADCGEFAALGGRTAIVQLFDQSGQGNHLSGYNISGSYVTKDHRNIPETLAGRDVAVFDAAWLKFPDGMMDGITSATFVVIVKAFNDPALASNYVGSWDLGGSAQAGIYSGHTFNGGAGHIHEEFGSTARHAVGNPAGSLAGYRVYAVRATNGGYKVWLDGDEIYGSGSNIVAWPSLLKIGARGTNSDLAIAALAIHRDLSEAEVQDVIATLADTYGLTVGGGGSVGGDPGSGGDPGQNPGGGPSGNDPVPDPNPIGGTRIYGAFALPSTGGGHWNGTIRPARPSYVRALLDSARSHGMRLGIMPYGPAGPNSGLFSGGRFSPSNWKSLTAQMAGNSDLEDGIEDGTAAFNYLLDEPKLVPRWGYAISDDVLEDMAEFARSIWPTWPSYYRLAPTQISRHLNGLTGLFATYRDGRGGTPAQYFAREYARSLVVNHSLIVNINCTHYTSSGAPITVAQFEAAARAAAEIPSDAMMVWDYRAGSWYALSGMPAKVQEMGVLYHAGDPP